ncbi:MAG TPA: FUSC family protein [Silvibacterium sp.]|jgi:uncharacterized membrane protein YgaE (UPF0421/DUF939 family)|nr:FUSC family protein [Silvibacterium sp.]
MAMDVAAAEGDIRSWWDKKEFGKKAIGSVKTGLAAVLSVLAANLLGLSYPYWAAISAIVVLGWDTTLTIASCRDRIIGTAIGASLGWATFYVWHGHYIFYGVSIAICIFLCNGLQFEKAGRLAGATLSLIVLVQPDNSPGRVALDRFTETSIGVVIALLISLLPPRPPKTDAKATV